MAAASAENSRLLSSSSSINDGWTFSFQTKKHITQVETGATFSMRTSHNVGCKLRPWWPHAWIQQVDRFIFNVSLSDHFPPLIFSSVPPLFNRSFTSRGRYTHTKHSITVLIRAQAAHVNCLNKQISFSLSLTEEESRFLLILHLMLNYFVIHYIKLKAVSTHIYMHLKMQ